MKPNNKVLLNAIIGDICGSIYEFSPIKDKLDELIEFAYKRLPKEMINVIEEFDEKVINS